jgi:hypothetical protein
MLETLSILVHADSKVGKTTMASTSPPPMLILDAEGGSKFLPIRKVTWNPQQGPPPAYDGTWEACVVIVRDFDTMRMVFQWLQSGQHTFRSLIVDSITEVQRRCKQNLAGTEAMNQQAWGQLLTLMDSLIRGFRDLTLHPTNPIQVVVFIAETRQSNNGKWRPYMQGQIDIALPYWMDVVGYLYVDHALDANGQPTVPVRKLLITAGHPQFEAGERVQGRLPGVVEQPNVTQMLLQVYPHLAQPAAPTEATVPVA